MEAAIFVTNPKNGRSMMISVYMVMFLETNFSPWYAYWAQIEQI